MPPKTPPETCEAILLDIKQGGMSTRQIGARHGVSDATVRKLAKDAGLNGAFSREQTKRATEAKAVDHKAQLVEIASRTASTALAVLASFDDMTVEDWRKVSPYSRGLIVGIMADKARELTPDDSGAGEIGSLLGGLLGHLKAKHGDAPAE